MRKSFRIGFSLLIVVVAGVAVLGGSEGAERPQGGKECGGADIGGLAYSHIMSPACKQRFAKICPGGFGSCTFSTQFDFNLVLLPTAATVDSAFWEIDADGTFLPVPAGAIKDSTGQDVTFPFNNPGAGSGSNTEIPWTVDVTAFDETHPCETTYYHTFQLKVHVTSTPPETHGSTSSNTDFSYLCVTSVPTISEWGAIILLATLLLVGGSILLVRRRREA